MSKPSPPEPEEDGSRVSRRSFLKTAGVSAAASALLANVVSSAATPSWPRRGALTADDDGAAQTVTVEPRVTLLRALRNHLDLTGAKEVCDRGGCGAAPCCWTASRSAPA